MTKVEYDNPAKSHRSSDIKKEPLTLRKTIRFKSSLLNSWDPKGIRSYIDSDPSYMGSDKTTKTIWLTETQAKKWHPKLIRQFLRSCKGYDDPEIKEGFEILVKMFNFLMKDLNIKIKIRNYFTIDGKPSKDYVKVMNSIKKLKRNT